MTPVVGRIAVLGLGLLGGSLALAARRRGVAASVTGATRRREVLDEAGRSGALDRATPDAAAAVRNADLVVLATPVAAMAGVLRRAAPGLREGCVVTDVGSVKAPLEETLPGLLPRGVHYVGSHPMAGGHEGGFRHAREDLFEGAACVVMTGGEPTATGRVVDLWRALGARVVMRDAATHDAEVAWVSHVPHLLAFAFGKAWERAGAGAAEVRGPGFRDFTRIAHSDPELWADILTANRKAIAAPLQAVRRALEQLEGALEAGDAESVERSLHAARQALAAEPIRGTDAAPSHEPPTAERSGGARGDNSP